MKSVKLVGAALVAGTVLLVAGCARMPEFPFSFSGDISPPVIVGMSMPSATLLQVDFDEPVSVVAESITCSGSVRIDGADVAGAGRSVEFRFDEPPSPAEEHFLEAQVNDASSNNLRFAVRFHGLNPLLPAMIINEFTCQGSGGHPDFVEVRALTSGNTAGACLYEGTAFDWDQRLVFPSIDVAAGDFLVVHFKPDGLPGEIDETVRKDSSGGADATENAWDLWVPGGSGLSGNNGVLSLCENPLGGLIDAVVYSNRSSDSDERYGGFGSATMQARVAEIGAAGHWLGSGALIVPEDAVNPDPSTATRSICRTGSSEDTDSAADWHITPTRGLSPGEINTDDRYEPP